MFYAEFLQEARESWTEFASAIRSYSLNRKRRLSNQIPDELHTRAYGVLAMKSREHEPGAIIQSIVLSLRPGVSKREAGIHLYFSSGTIQYIKLLAFFLPISFSGISDFVSFENAVYGRLIKNQSGDLCEFQGNVLRSRPGELFGESTYFLFCAFIRSIPYCSTLWSRGFRNQSFLPVYPISSNPPGDYLARHSKDIRNIADLSSLLDDIFHFFYFHMNIVITLISWAHMIG